MKTRIIRVSRLFLSNHPRAGENTNFPLLILSNKKIHTLRLNYEYWAKIIKEVQNGESILSVRYWLDKPFRSKQSEFLRLDHKSDIGIQELQFKNHTTYIDNKPINYLTLENLALNDGLSFTDFRDWFKASINQNPSQPIAIIHFTKYRY